MEVWETSREWNCAIPSVENPPASLIGKPLAFAYIGCGWLPGLVNRPRYPADPRPTITFSPPPSPSPHPLSLFTLHSSTTAATSPKTRSEYTPHARRHTTPSLRLTPEHARTTCTAALMVHAGGPSATPRGEPNRTRPMLPPMRDQSSYPRIWRTGR